MAISINGTSGISGVDGSAATPAIQGTDTNTGISFGTDEVNINTGGTAAVTVDSSQRVGIGTATASEKLEVAGNVKLNSEQPKLSFVDTNNNQDASVQSFYGSLVFSSDENSEQAGSSIQFKVDGTERFRISSTGRGFINADTDCFSISSVSSAASGNALINARHSGTAGSQDTGTTCFVVETNGDVSNTNNSYGSLSDAKLKENIVDANSQWNDLRAIQVRNYNFKEETGHQTHTQIGVIAQEVELVSPGLVSESPDRDEEGNDLGTVTKSVNYSVLYMKSVKALQEAMERIEQLETRLAALEGGTN